MDVVQPKEAVTITIGPPEGPGSSANLPPQRGPLAIPTQGADIFYELPPVEAVKPRTGFAFGFTGAKGRGDPPASMTQSSYINYEGWLTHPDVFKPSVNRQITFGKSEQRPDPDKDASNFTKTSFAAQRNICTPATYKHTRMPARRFGPGPGLPINPRFRSSPDLTKDSYMANGSPSLQATKRRNGSAIMTGSVRSAIMDARMELRATAQLMAF